MKIFDIVNHVLAQDDHVELVIFEGATTERRAYDRAQYFKRCLVVDYNLNSIGEIESKIGVVVVVRNSKVVLRRSLTWKRQS